jgi:hypothetical protein
MAFKPNYNQQRSDRNRAKEQKKQARLQRRDEEAAKRKASRGDGTEATGGEATPGGLPDPETPPSDPNL